MTYIEQILKGSLLPDYTVSIVGDGISLLSVLSESLSITGQVDWASNNILPDKLNSLVKAGTSLANKADLTSASGLTVMDTTFKWSGTTNQSFSLQLIFATTDNHNNIATIQQVNKLIYPHSNTAGLYTAPLDYKGGDDKSGLLNVSIGDWFRATDVVCKSASLNIEPIFSENGRPILVKSTLDFSAYKLLTADEVNTWFR